MGNESADCFRCIVLDSMNIMKKHFIMKHISFMMGKKALAAVLIMLSGGAGAFAQEWIDVTEGYIKNADYSEGNTGWTLTGDKITLNAEFRNAEIYDRKSSVSQQINGLPVGTYKVSVRGYYRAGNDGTAYTAHQNSSEVIQGYLFVDDATEPLVSVFSADPKPADVNLSGKWFEPSDLAGAGYPTSMEAMRKFLDEFPACYINELEFTVTADNPDVLIGIRTDGGPSGHWTCWSDFKLYVEGTAYDLLNSKIKELTDVRTQLQDMGATSAAGELSTVIEQYGKYTEDTPEEDINLAIAEINSRLEVASVAIASCTNLEEAKTTGETLLTDCTNGKYTAAEQDRQKLSGVMDGVNNVISSTSLEELDAVVAEQLPVMNKGISDLRTVIAMNYSLVKAKDLADRIGGLEATAEYVAVENALNEGGLEYDALKAAVQGLNAVCVKNMTSEFFASVTEENPIELTNFIVNPNICQGDNKTQMPDGWTLERLDGKNWDGKDYTNSMNDDTDLLCYSWSGNANYNVGNGWYYQQIGGSEATLALPRGCYVLKAATYSTGGDNAAYLYVSTDNTSDHIMKSRINTNYDTYQTARTNQETTTATEMIEVKDGTLYLGMRGRCIDGEGYVGGSGKYWNADNFRLYYVKPLPSVEDLKKEVEDMVAAGVVLNEIGATTAAADMQQLADTYNAYTDQTTEEEVFAAREHVKQVMELFTVLPELNATLIAELSAGTSLLEKCKDGAYYASEATQAILKNVMDNASGSVAQAGLENLETTMTAQVAAVNGSVADLRTRVSFNDVLLKAKALADEITGLSDDEAYQNLNTALDVATLSYDEMKATVTALNAVCAAAMTPAFLSGATEEQPIDMTSFIVNPNIYQNNANTGTYLAPDGWNCDMSGSFDNKFPTSDAETDTDLFCYSWSGNADNTIGKGWYYQQIGGTDGAVNLPDGMYVLKAATYSTGGGNAAYLYASVDNTAEQMVKSNINTDGAVYDAARTNLETTTTTEVIEVKNGVLYIGMKGRSIDEGGYVGGTGRQWNADNFRLYYVGALETTVNLTMKVDWATLMLPFDAELQEGMTAYSCASVAEDGMLNLVKVEDGLKANVPYIINAATGNQFEFTGISCAEAETYKVGLLTGVHNETEAPVASYVLQNQESDGLAFYRVAENKQPKVGANRAYLTLPETLGANVRVVYFPTDTDGVTDVEAADVMVDVYTLDGICVRSQVKKSEALKGLKGIYILKNVK